MSLNSITVDIHRYTTASDAGGGETLTDSTVYTGLNASISFKDLSSIYRFEKAGTEGIGPGALVEGLRVVFIDNWDGTEDIHQSDRVVPNPIVNWLPSALDVVDVRKYEDGAVGEIQLDTSDIA